MVYTISKKHPEYFFLAPAREYFSKGAKSRLKSRYSDLTPPQSSFSRFIEFLGGCDSPSDFSGQN